jgi:uncharacterized protein (TIGR03000 family)
MYSVVLMAALTTGGTAPDCHFRGGCGCYGGCNGGGYGGDGGWGYGMGGNGGTMSPSTTMPSGATTTPSGEKLMPPTPDKETMASSRAKLIVELPPDAKLYIDDLPISKTSEVANFITPTLKRERSYYYLVRAEVIRDGKPVTQTRRVTVRAGQTARANFKDMDTEAVSTARSK